MARLNEQQLTAAREWVKDCSWGEQYEPEEIDALAASVIERGVNRFYEGGLHQFIRDCEPLLVVSPRELQ